MLVWLLYFTCRKKFTGYEIFKKYRNRPAIFVFWHGRTLMLPPIVCIGRMRGYIVASAHRDGQIMGRIQQMFGLRVIRGSSTHGGVNVLREGVRVLRDGRYCVGLSPDGPSGPSMRFHDGALYFAKMTGAPIIPVCISASRCKMRNTWDRYLIPMPFSRVTCTIGEPVFVNRRATDAEFENIRTQLEDIMVSQLREMDAEFNLPFVEQDQKASAFKRALRAQRDAARAQKKTQRGK